MTRLALAALALVAACGAPTERGPAAAATWSEAHHFLVSWRFDAGGPSRGENAFEFGVSDPSGATLAPAAVEVSLLMSAHGHGSTRSPRVIPLADSRFRIEGVFFTMAGEWVVTIRIRGGGRDDAASFTVDVP